MTIAPMMMTVPSTNPQNQVVPELLFKFLLLLFKLNPVGPDLAAHVAELGVAIHPTKATFKIAERPVQNSCRMSFSICINLCSASKALNASCTSLLGI
jgi:hypothetical protein